MKAATIHYNPPESSTRTACGLSLRRYEHRTDIADVTCNSCRRIASREGKKS